MRLFGFCSKYYRIRRGGRALDPHITRTVFVHCESAGSRSSFPLASLSPLPATIIASLSILWPIPGSNTWARHPSEPVLHFAIARVILPVRATSTSRFLHRTPPLPTWGRAWPGACTPRNKFQIKTPKRCGGADPDAAPRATGGQEGDAGGREVGDEAVGAHRGGAPRQTRQAMQVLSNSSCLLIPAEISPRALSHARCGILPIMLRQRAS